MHKREASCFGSNCIPGEFNKRVHRNGLRLIENNSSRKITFSHLFPVTILARTRHMEYDIGFSIESVPNPCETRTFARDSSTLDTRWKRVNRYRRAEKGVIKIRRWKLEQSIEKENSLGNCFHGRVQSVEILGCWESNFVFFSRQWSTKHSFHAIMNICWIVIRRFVLFCLHIGTKFRKPLAHRWYTSRHFSCLNDILNLFV